MRTLGIALAAACALMIVGPTGAFAADRIDVYPLETCAVAGSKLGSMGDPVVVRHEGREFRFCCGKCTGKLEADPAKYIASVDERIIAQQRASYPLATCPISGETLGEDAHEFVVNNRLVRTCCKKCAAQVIASPAATLAKIDTAIVAAQGKDYPLATCPVSGHALGEGGKPVDYLVGHRLVRVCCADCKEELTKNPLPALAAVDAAWAAKAGAGKGEEPKPAEKPKEPKPAEKPKEPKPPAKPEPGAKPPAPGKEQ